jgi:hypothetical protein
MDELFAICLGGRAEANRAMDKIGTLAGTGVTRMWHFSAEDGRAHTVVVRHDHMFGRRVVELDGAVVHESTGEMDCSIYYEVCGKPGKVTITSRVDGVTVLFYYENEYDGVEVPCTMHDVDGAGSLSQYEVTIPGHKLMRGTVYYKIVSRRRPDGDLADRHAPRVTQTNGMRSASLGDGDGDGAARPPRERAHAVYRKFGEFQALHAEVRATFVGAHESMKTRVPHLPAAYWKLVVDHLDPVFIEERRRALAVYLQRLVGLSRTASNADIRSFLRITEKAGSSAGGPRSGRGSRRGERVALHGDARCGAGRGRGSAPSTAVNAMVTMASSGGRNVRDAARRASENPYGVEDDDEVAEGEGEAAEVRRGTLAAFLRGGAERPALTVAAAGRRGTPSPPPPPPPGRLGPASAGAGGAAAAGGEPARLSIALM